MREERVLMEFERHRYLIRRDLPRVMSTQKDISTDVEAARRFLAEFRPPCHHCRNTGIGATAAIMRMDAYFPTQLIFYPCICGQPVHPRVREAAHLLGRWCDSRCDAIKQLDADTKEDRNA